MPSEWLESRTGQALLDQERRQAGLVLERVFGDQIVQIGSWGPPGLLVEAARTQAALVFGQRPEPGLNAVVAPDRLAILTDSVDAVLLPHTLELSPEPHGVLREVHRVLRPDGRLIVLGFNPVSWWGLRHVFGTAGYPAGIRRHISTRRLNDWLRLLSMRADIVRPTYLRPARSGLGRLGRRTGWFAAAYIVVATKETIPMTVVRPRLGKRAALVGTLVNPSARNAA